MGCDIHLYGEVKINDRWEHAGPIDVGRNYDLFGCMVEGHSRGYGIDGIAPARGLPEDVNPYTKILVERWGDHTFSWLSFDECMRVNHLYRDQVKDHGNYKAFVLEDGWDLPLVANNDNFRVVFGFDS